MFQADMAENRTKKVAIKDIDSEVVQEMLHFIYTGGANEKVLKQKARELLAAAERYQLDDPRKYSSGHPTGTSLLLQAARLPYPLRLYHWYFLCK